MTAPDSSPRPSARPALSAARDFWQMLARPAAGLTDLAERRQAELLASLALFFSLLLGSGAFASSLALRTEGLRANTLILMGLTVAALLVYALGRSRYWRFGAWLLAILLMLGALASGLSDPARFTSASLSLLPFTLVISNVLLGFAGTGLLLAASLVAVFAISLFVPIAPRDLTLVMGSMGALGTLLLITVGFRNNLERERLAEVSAVNRELQALGAQLEQRVADRTRDLALAAEVGRSLAKARDLNALLGEAVELIRDRFDLYHAQVYLLDAPGQRLLLQAGSGAIGAELLRRQHRLAVNLGSLNGQAVLERRPVLVADTLTDPNFKPNSLLPETRSEAVIPLLVEDRVLGVLDLQSVAPGSFTSESLPAFQALAGQLAIGIENALLLKETEAARAELAEQTRRLSRTGWQDFLDSINRAERLERRYLAVAEPVADSELTKQTVSAQGERPAITVPIAVAGEEAIGLLRVEAGDRRGWSPDDVELVEAVARQIAEQVDDLRLIAQAEQYRAEAEDAVRRLTREGWLTHLAEADQPPAYVYNGEQVLAGDATTADTWRPQPLTLRGEPLGEIAIEAGAAGPEAEQIVNAVAEQLTAHLENLRLSLQTEQALAENQKRANQLARLSQMEQALSLATTEEEIVEAVRPAFSADGLTAIVLSYVTGDERRGARTLDAAALWAGGRFQPERLPALQNLSFDQHPLTPLWVMRPAEPTFLRDVATDARASEAVRALAGQEGWCSALLLPLRSGGQWQGLLSIHWAGPHTLSADEAFFADRLMETMAGVTASRRASLAQQQALAENVRRNRELTALNRIVTTAASAREVAVLLQSAVQEVTQLIQARSAGFGLLEPDGKHLRIVADYSGAADKPSAVGVLIPIEGNLSTQRVIETQRALVVNAAQTDPLTASIHELMRERRTEALLIAPLIVRGEVIGTLGVDLDVPGRTFSPQEIAMVETLAGQLAGAIDNLRLYAETQRRAERERLINTITQKIQGTATVPHALQTAIQELGLALKAKRTRVELSPPVGAPAAPNGH